MRHFASQVGKQNGASGLWMKTLSSEQEYKRFVSSEQSMACKTSVPISGFVEQILIGKTMIANNTAWLACGRMTAASDKIELSKQNQFCYGAIKTDVLWRGLFLARFGFGI